MMTQSFYSFICFLLLAGSAEAFTNTLRSQTTIPQGQFLPPTIVSSQAQAQAQQQRQQSSLVAMRSTNEKLMTTPPPPTVTSSLEEETDIDFLTLEERELTTQRVDTVFYTNAIILSVLGLSVMFQLFHVDIEAIVALWEYDLGLIEQEGLTKMAVTIDLLTRLPYDWVHSYEALIPTNPIFYKACTSGVAYGLGDLISQVYQGKSLSTLDLPRSLRSGTAGFIGHGPLCHYWLLFMETNLDFNGAWWATGIKVTADLTIWSIFLNAAYSFIIGILSFRNPKDVLEDVKITLWPALRSAWRFWPFVHTISFSHAVPIDLKLLWVDIMEVVWVTILSKVANEDKVARIESNPNLVELGENQKKNVLKNVDPALEIELTREIEMVDKTTQTPLSQQEENALSFELPKKVLSACWPLIAMWPVLYAGYRIEIALGLVSAST